MGAERVHLPSAQDVLARGTGETDWLRPGPVWGQPAQTPHAGIGRCSGTTWCCSLRWRASSSTASRPASCLPALPPAREHHAPG